MVAAEVTPNTTAAPPLGITRRLGCSVGFVIVEGSLMLPCGGMVYTLLATGDGSIQEVQHSNNTKRAAPRSY